MPGFLRDGHILWALVAEADLNTHECFIVELDVKISLKIGCRCTKESTLWQFLKCERI